MEEHLRQIHEEALSKFQRIEPNTAVPPQQRWETPVSARPEGRAEAPASPAWGGGASPGLSAPGAEEPKPGGGYLFEKEADQ